MALLYKYKERENDKKEYYFIIESKDHEPLGLVRMYDFKNDSFCCGSWLIKEDAPKSTAIESALQIYEFGFYQLGFNQSHFEVQKGNDKVISFHQRFGAKIVDESNPLSEEIHNHVLSLPISGIQTLEMTKKIIEVINDF